MNCKLEDIDICDECHLRHHNKTKHPFCKDCTTYYCKGMYIFCPYHGVKLSQQTDEEYGEEKQ